MVAELSVPHQGSTPSASRVSLAPASGCGFAPRHSASRGGNRAGKTAPKKGKPNKRGKRSKERTEARQQRGQGRYPELVGGTSSSREAPTRTVVVDNPVTSKPAEKKKVQSIIWNLDNQFDCSPLQGQVDHLQKNLLNQHYALGRLRLQDRGGQHVRPRSGTSTFWPSSF